MDEHHSSTTFAMVLERPDRMPPRNVLVCLCLLTDDHKCIEVGSVLFDDTGNAAALDLDGFRRGVSRRQLPPEPRLAAFITKVISSLTTRAAVRNLAEFPAQVPWHPLSVSISEIMPV